jgi:hypothetical protein
MHAACIYPNFIRILSKMPGFVQGNAGVGDGGSREARWGVRLRPPHLEGQTYLIFAPYSLRLGVFA